MYKKSNDLAISIRDLSKMYKVYNNKSQKVIDLLNLGFLTRTKKYNEFWALKDINIDIKKGEKLGIIGRNGAGKSTLLKIITGNVKQTTGDINIQGKVSALLELGTGFHPEFTGRENIFASLAYMGLNQKEAKMKYESILEFSELEDFIDKPIKTYSAGMYTRLAFSVATSIEPEILIIDEVLGAGDAYFLNKSIEKMKQLTEGGTTVLFVSHDINSVQKMCNKAIWIDHGKIIMSGDTLEVSKEYMYSIRKQEELRLRARNLKIKQNQLRSVEVEDNNKYIGHFIAEDGTPKDEHPISRIFLNLDNEKISELILGDAMDNDQSRELSVLINNETINWSLPHKVDGRTVRTYKDIGGIYEHAVFTLNLIDTGEEHKYKLNVEHKDVSHEVINVEIFDGKKYINIGQLSNQGDNEWKVNSFDIPSKVYSAKKQDIDEESSEESSIVSANQYLENEAAEELIKNDQTLADEIPDDDTEDIELPYIDRNTNDIYGTGEVIITDVKFLDKYSKPRYLFTTGEDLTIRINYRAKKKINSAVFVVAIYKPDGTCITQLISSKDGFHVKSINGSGYVDAELSPLLIGKGDYIISVAIFKGINLLDPIEQEAYDLHDRRYQIKIEQPFDINVELGEVVHPVSWRK